MVRAEEGSGNVCAGLSTTQLVSAMLGVAYTKQPETMSASVDFFGNIRLHPLKLRLLNAIISVTYTSKLLEDAYFREAKQIFA